ncbi:ABC transporter ATP-binding protein [Shimazuella sp. AN120528]|uniref:ABC transporter ATP-binding protein n=1 Tax=Shimazuella soli TaxID=1892854 RepID=UPI001F0F534F|nr:ABC transporter ATP-binding protein [Shimazuella soli]MCH5583367.1 ABC transporter ATP-binding protein [Shimazuella soli]
MIIHAKEISKIFGSQIVLDSIDILVESNEWVSILGPNGSGKSTLLSCLAGSSKIDSGKIEIKGKDIYQYAGKDKAKIIAFLTQEALPDMPNTVEEIVQMGRYPHQTSRLPWLQKQDMQVVEEAMVFTETISLRHRQMSQLSGGERQRVSMALALAQQPEILLLDEPTTYLDVYYQLAFFDLLKKWQKRNKTTIISVLHDLNLASLYSDRCLLLRDGKLIDAGEVTEILTLDNVKQTYGIEPIILKHPLKKVPQILLKGESE